MDLVLKAVVLHSEMLFWTVFVMLIAHQVMPRKKMENGRELQWATRSRFFAGLGIINFAVIMFSMMAGILDVANNYIAVFWAVAYVVGSIAWIVFSWVTDKITRQDCLLFCILVFAVAIYVVMVAQSEIGEWHRVLRFGAPIVFGFMGWRVGRALDA